VADVNDDGIVLGHVEESTLDANAAGTVEQAMHPGPRTVRPNATIDTIRRRVQKHDLATLIVTRSDGRLVGVVRRDLD
jgi:Mg/Co/Ni transporter MgtE